MSVGCGSGRATHETVKGRSWHEYRIFEPEPFARDLKRIARPGHEDTVRKLRTVVCPQLTHHLITARTIRKLKHDAPETWRYRIGAWRFFYFDESADDKRTRCS